MTTSEMIQNFRMAYDIVNLEGPGYDDEEVLVFLNTSQDIEVKKEAAIRRWTYISNLISNITLNTSVPAWSLYQYHRIVSVPSETYLAYIGSKSKIERTIFKPLNGAEWVDNILIPKENSGRYISNTNNWPILLNPRVYEEATGNVSVIYDKNTTFSGSNDFILEYIRKPSQITLISPCEVNEVMHERIVNTAVDLAKKVFTVQEAAASKQTDTLIKNPEM
jgi:hypothetical protein